QGRVVIHLAEPAANLGLGHLGALMHRHEYSLGDRKRVWVPPALLQRGPYQRDTPGKGGGAGATSSHPAVPNGRRPPQCIGVTTTQPHRRVWLLDRLWSHGAVLQ